MRQICCFHSTYQDQNAIMKPNQEKKKTRPWTHRTLNIGTVLAFLLIGLHSGEVQRVAQLKPMMAMMRCN